MRRQNDASLRRHGPRQVVEFERKTHVSWSTYNYVEKRGLARARSAPLWPVAFHWKTSSRVSVSEYEIYSGQQDAWRQCSETRSLLQSELRQ
eukprot:759178-Pleurochrysis_carterae.AAC.1